MVMALPPRGDVRQDFLNTANLELEKVALEEGSEFFQTAGKQNAVDFLQDTYDGIHFGSTQWRGILRRVLDAMGEDDSLPAAGSRVDRNFLFPGVCWTCGGNHRAAESHDTFPQCKWCDDSLHAEAVCLTHRRMCLRCGRRGHKAARCPSKNQ